MVAMPTNDDPVRIVRGDCMGVMRALPDGCVQAVITDPPYGMDYQSAWRTDKADWFPKIANDDQPYIWWLRDAARVLAEDGCLICFCRWDSAEAFRLAIGWAGLTVAAQLVWDRVIHGMGDLKRTPAPRHDVMWFATKPGYTLPGKRPNSVYQVQRIGGEDLTHPNEKPLALIRQLVLDYTRPGDIVADWFVGSGSTPMACVTTGRLFIGTEISVEYAEAARKRIDDALGVGGLFCPTAPVVVDLFGG